MPGPLADRTILLLSSNFGTETDEIRRPLEALREAGATVTVAATKAGTVQTLVLDHDFGPEVPVDTTYDAVQANDFDALVLPGGTLNGDALRTDETVQSLVRGVAEAGRPVAAICHAPWILVESGLVDGRRLTSVPTIRTDMVNAGAEWVDEEVVLDDSGGFRLITSRSPDDLDAFHRAILDALT
ncbi:MAG: type 1 glutamine amidotransferase [Brachybacterium sp.]|uniref:type 1 glutamine amidotransferase domain-containing protein n=1 Tax=Brachybacterium sp. TaxID=1891286 RepID=UPI0026496657|nr:type 1 glutamine amidotransferase domain-containing protein [Brachybacterium sp.]MDN5687866.1 type 1 glutamine amidotransferase [Brachybacterium sp.]